MDIGDVNSRPKKRPRQTLGQKKEISFTDMAKTRFKFGKYKDECFGSVVLGDTGYARWLANKTESDFVRTLLNQLLGDRHRLPGLVEPVVQKRIVSDKFTFGKYKGMLYSDVLKEDRSYIEWCAENLKSDTVRKTMTKLLNSES